MRRKKKFKWIRKSYNKYEKYDRAFVKKLNYRHLSFTKSSDTKSYWFDNYEPNCNKKMLKYIHRFLVKRLGKDINKVKQDFYKLNFELRRDMHYVWRTTVDSLTWNGNIYGYYTAEDNTLQYNRYKKNR